MDLVALTASIENLLIKNNTITSANDISGSLNTRVQKTYKGVDGMHEKLPVPDILYPVVFVELDVSSDEFAQANNSARRNKLINFNIIAVTHYGAGSSNEGESRENADQEVIQLSQNIENLFRANINISNTVDWCNIETADYSAAVEEDTYNSISKITLNTRKFTT